jgi:hypothetical protein
MRTHEVFRIGGPIQFLDADAAQATSLMPYVLTIKVPPGVHRNWYESTLPPGSVFYVTSILIYYEPPCTLEKIPRDFFLRREYWPEIEIGINVKRFIRLHPSPLFLDRPQRPGVFAFRTGSFCGTLGTVIYTAREIPIKQPQTFKIRGGLDNIVTVVTNPDVRDGTNPINSWVLWVQYWGIRANLVAGPYGYGSWLNGRDLAGDGTVMHTPGWVPLKEGSWGQFIVSASRDFTTNDDIVIYAFKVDEPNWHAHEDNPGGLTLGVNDNIISPGPIPIWPYNASGDDMLVPFGRTRKSFVLPVSRRADYFVLPVPLIARRYERVNVSALAGPNRVGVTLIGLRRYEV